MRPEKMRMWQAAECMVAEIDPLLRRARRRSPHAADHLERSMESVLCNMAEGIAAYPPRVKCAIYEIAKREANEVRALLRRLTLNGVLTQAEIARPYNLATTVIVMLTRAINSLRERT